MKDIFDYEIHKNVISIRLSIIYKDIDNINNDILRLIFKTRIYSS